MATAAGGVYTFASSLTLLAATQYFFYENASISVSGGNIYGGGQAAFTSSSSSPCVLVAGQSASFRVAGAPVTSAVPENGATILFLFMGASALFAGRRVGRMV
jgi:hypothetical protein